MTLADPLRRPLHRLRLRMGGLAWPNSAGSQNTPSRYVPLAVFNAFVSEVDTGARKRGSGIHAMLAASTRARALAPPDAA